MRIKAVEEVRLLIIILELVVDKRPSFDLGSRMARSRLAEPLVRDEVWHEELDLGLWGLQFSLVDLVPVDVAEEWV